MSRRTGFLHAVSTALRSSTNATHILVMGRSRGNRSFRIQVISYPLASHFVLFWSFHIHFYFQFGHFVPILYPVLVISYLLLLFSRKPFWSFRTYFLLFRTQVILHPKSFRTHFSHFVPTSKLGTSCLGYEMTFFLL